MRPLTEDEKKIVEAFVNRATIRGRRKGEVMWCELIDPVLNFTTHEYHIAKKLRPWTPDEVPLGHQGRCKDKTGRCLITQPEFWCGQAVLDDYEHAAPGHPDKVTWLPCGVEE